MFKYKVTVPRDFNNVSIEDLTCFDIHKVSIVVKVILIGISRSPLMEFCGGR